MVPFFKHFRPDLVFSRTCLRHPHLWPLAFSPFIVFVSLVMLVRAMP